MIFSPLERGQGCVRIHLHDVFINHFVNDYHTPLPLSRGDLIMKWYQNDTIQKRGISILKLPFFYISYSEKSFIRCSSDKRQINKVLSFSATM
jgi:hypothetical protein